MFKKFKEQISCIECASITAEEIYQADKRNPPLRRPPPNHHDDFSIRSRTASSRSSVNSSFAHSHSSYGYQHGPTRPGGYTSNSLPNHGHEYRHTDSVKRYRDRPPSRDSSFHNQSSRSLTNSESFMQPQHPSVRRIRTSEPQLHNSSKENSRRVVHSSFDSARNDLSFQNDRRRIEETITMGVQMRNSSSQSQRQERPHSATATMMHNRPKTNDAPPVSLRNREQSGMHPSESRHSASNMDQEVPQRRSRSVSFAGTGPNVMKPMRRRARSVSGSEDVVDAPANLCNPLSNSLVSIVKNEWQSQTNIASDSECMPSRIKQVKGILKKPCASVESNSPRNEKKLRTGSVTFADKCPSWRESSIKHKHLDYGRDSPVPFSDTRVGLPGGQPRSTLQDIPDGYVDDRKMAKIKHVQHKPPLPHGTKLQRASRELSGDSDYLSNNVSHVNTAQNAIGAGTLDISAEVTQAANFDYTQNATNVNRRTPTLPSPKTEPKKFVVKRDFPRRSSIDSDNCSSSLSSESSLLDTKSLLRNSSRANRMNAATHTSASLDQYYGSYEEENNSPDNNPAVVPSIRKGRSTSRRNRKPAFASMTLQRIDSDTTDSGLSLDYSATPQSSLDLPQYRRAQRMQKKTMSLPRDMQFSSNAQAVVLTMENETHDPTFTQENVLLNKQAPTLHVPLGISAKSQDNIEQVLSQAQYNVSSGSSTTISYDSTNKLSTTANHDFDANHDDRDIASGTAQNEPDSDNLTPTNNSPPSTRPRKASKKGEHKKKHTKRTSKKLTRQKNVANEDYENLPVEEEKLLEPMNEPCLEEFPPPPSILPVESESVNECLPRESYVDDLINKKSRRKNVKEALVTQNYTQVESVQGTHCKPSQTQPPKTSIVMRKTSSFSRAPSQQLAEKDAVDWTLRASDLPSSTADTASIQSRGSFSDLVIQQYDDASLRSYMGQNDVSRVIVPRDSVRTGRLMMKDDTNTFCMCSGTFRAPTSPRDSQSKCRPITVQIYRGLNDKEDRVNLLKNTTVLLQLSHENVHAVYGMCLEGSPHTREGREVFVLLERTHYLVNLNQLLAWTSENNPQLMTTGCAITFALQMCEGLQFLEDRGIIHANLSSNTIRLDRYCTIKIGGIEQFPVSSTAAPIRWMALETLSKGQILPKSTVWTFGVVLWEILSVGGRPYQNLKIGQILNRLSKGHRLPRPQNCSQFLYHFLLNCWQPNPEERPTFPEITKSLGGYKDKLLPSKPPAEIFPDREDFWKILHDHI